MTDISPDWKGSTRRERRIITGLVKYQGTPQAIARFAEDCRELSDYWYWFTLGTLWVNYSGHSDLTMWKRLFSAPRPNRATSLMKPSEMRSFDALPERFEAYRAHRTGEQDWIAYTVDRQVAARFADERGVEFVMAYAIAKRDVLALFTRRGEAEILVLNRHLPQRLGAIDILIWPEHA